jgi:hypothetical protein
MEEYSSLLSSLIRHYEAGNGHSLSTMLQEETEGAKSLLQVDMHDLRVTLLLQQKLLLVYKDFTQELESDKLIVPDDIKAVLYEIFPRLDEESAAEKPIQRPDFPWQLFITRLGSPPDEDPKERSKLVFKSDSKDDIARLGSFFVERLAMGDTRKFTKISLHESTWVVSFFFIFLLICN